MVGLPERALSDTAWVLEIDPGYSGALLFDAVAKQALGRYEEAALALPRYDERLPPEMRHLSGFEQAWREGGSGCYLDSMKGSSAARGNLLATAATCGALGDADGAFEILEKGSEAKDTSVTYLLIAYLDRCAKTRASPTSRGA